ncbi:hypothetical protein O6H91_16G084300 [Diphasiastrum complanatum]|uniref:Uncharacterized protein n=2 Tax=Diphasiastrum complanatum TaxID=34168 RepID=A0ACC2BE63_DIPCM|nr:hypothetical protein O6H91_16G084100 [Diphasiastrum complanatum]KAJ7528104.1 hypothetical protein O6H91_16G084300 [Diphasiastrum complanatum]
MSIYCSSIFCLSLPTSTIFPLRHSSPHPPKPCHYGHLFSVSLQHQWLCTIGRSAESHALQPWRGVVRAESDAVAAGSSNEEASSENVRLISDKDLKVGSPIVIIEAPPLLKTAEPMPMMRQNVGLIKPGDAGRIIDRRPKNVWAVRFAIGAYLIDRKYFKLLDVP